MQLARSHISQRKAIPLNSLAKFYGKLANIRGQIFQISSFKVLAFRKVNFRVNYYSSYLEVICNILNFILLF